MKNFFIFVVFLVAIFSVGVYLYFNYYQSPKYSEASVNSRILNNNTEKAPQEVTVESPGIPETLIIPKIGVNAPLESVGLDSKNNMDVPKEADNGAWYNLGYKPGEIGNSVIAGHLDKIDSSPAVFYNLETLKIGDEITIIDEEKNEYKFLVAEVKVYPWDEFPLQEVFGEYSKPRLNLITCKGIFDKENSNYSHRTVVYSELVN